MKLYQRYLLSHVRRPWIYILVGFSAIAVLVDLFDNFSEFMDGSMPFLQILLYYAVLIPTYMPYMLPVSILLALLYALWNLGKSSEITAMRACGLSLSQIISPFVSLGLACSVALLLINEFFNPWAMHWTKQFREDRELQRQGQVRLEHGFSYLGPKSHRRWSAVTFNPHADANYELKNLSIVQYRPDSSEEFRLEASRGLWLDGYWWFEDVKTRYFDRNNRPIGRVEPAAQLDLTSLSETPQDFIDETKDPETERSAADIRRFLATHDTISRAARNRHRTDYWYRLASPWLCIIVVLLGVPFGTSTSRKGMGMGILFALLSFFGYYVLMSFCLYWGKDAQALPPFLAAWLPDILFATLGIVLLQRIR